MPLHPRPVLVALLLSAVPAFPADLTVVVTGAPANSGQIGCALYPGADGFPLDNSNASQSWHPVAAGGATCSFTGLSAGTYAVAASHDANGNRKADTNAVGLPTEAWGVSNNARPRLRAPRFDEAAFSIGATGAHRIEITLK